MNNLKKFIIVKRLAWIRMQADEVQICLAVGQYGSSLEAILLILKTRAVDLGFLNVSLEVEFRLGEWGF